MKHDSYVLGCVLLVQLPISFDEDKQPVVKFPRILKGRTASSYINVKNNGILTAVARMDIQNKIMPFRIEGGSRLFTVASKQAQSFKVEFHPEDVGLHRHEVQIKVRISCIYFIIIFSFITARSVQ